MKRFNYVAIMLLLLSTIAAKSQTVPELVFQNPVLVSGTAGKDGAVYLFKNVTTGVDAAMKINKRSSAAVVLTRIDTAQIGWSKAFQPQLGIAGNVPANQNWWMEFEMTLLESGTNKTKKMDKFVVTALDVDGDGVSIKEYVQMDKVKSVAFSTVSYLQNSTSMVTGTVGSLLDDADDLLGTDLMVQGTVNNFTNIDTGATQVMATYTYEKKDKITFKLGATSGNAISNAGERLYSLWFKSFSLAPKANILPVKLQSFTAQYDKKNVLLNWETAMEVDFSHFIIERSTDGKNFSEAALVFSGGLNTDRESKYSYKDVNPSSATGMLYYRIRFVEKTQEFSYSPVQTIRLSKEQNSLQLTTFPNPVADQLKITLPSSWQGKEVVFELYNSNGSKMQQFAIKSASQTETLSMGQASRGLYVIKASCDQAVAEQRIIKN